MHHLFSGIGIVVLLILTPFLIMISNAVGRKEQEEIDDAITKPRLKDPK